MTPPATDRQLLTIIVPVCNEEAVLPMFHRRLATAIDTLPLQIEILYVNDGSTDTTLSCLCALRDADPRVGVIDLSRNFGKEIAMTAGLDHARGDAVVIIDADLQDPPELIPELVRTWQKGYEVVYAQRSERLGESWPKRMTAALFYRIIARISRVQIPRDTGDFRLLSRRAVDALLRLREQHRFMKGLFAWIGYAQTAVIYRRDARAAGTTKWSYWRLWNLALEGITSFTTAPLKLATYLGLATALIAFLYGLFVLWKALVHGDPVRGYPSLMLVILFLGGVQLMTLGVIGEYIGRMFDETKQRPLYLTRDYLAPQATVEMERAKE